MKKILSTCLRGVSQKTMSVHDGGKWFMDAAIVHFQFSEVLDSVFVSGKNKHSCKGQWEGKKRGKKCNKVF